MGSDVNVPEEAVDALCAALDRAGIQLTGWHTGRVALEAAAPAIRSQERERVREALVGPKARGALYDAHMRYQDVPKKTEEGWAVSALEAVARVVFNTEADHA